MDLLNTKEMADYNRTSAEREPRASEPSTFLDDQAMFEKAAVFSKKQMEEKQRIEDMESEILGGVWDYLKYDTAPGAIIQHLRESFQEPDVDFDPYHFDNFRAESEWENNQISEALNPEHYNLIKERLIDHREYEDNLASMGYGAFAIVVAGEVLNLSNYVLPSTGAVKAMKGIKRVAAAGALQATINVGETAVIDAVYEDRSSTEYLSTAALGFAFGAAFGGLLGTKNVDAIAETNKVIDAKAKFYSEIHMGNKAKEWKVSTTGKDSVGAARLQADPRVLDPDFDIRMRNQHLDPNDPLAIAAMIDATEGGLEKQDPLVVSKLGSQGYSTQTAENILLRKIGSDLAEKPEAKISQGIDKQTAALEVAIETDRLASLYAKRTDDLWRSFQKVEPNYKGLTNWNDLAFERLHRMEDLDRIGKEGNRILKEWGENRQAVWEGIAKKANAAGVEEFQDLGKVIDHVSRPYDPASMHRLTGEHGEDTMVKLFQKSLTGDGGFEKIYQKYVDKAVKKAEEFKAGPQNKAIAELETRIHNTRKELNALENKVSTKGTRLAGRLEDLNAKLYRLSKKENVHWSKFTGGGIDVDKISYEMAKQTMSRMMKRATVSSRDANMMNSHNQTLMRKVILGADMDVATKDAILHIMDTQGRDVAGKLGESRMHIDMGAEIMSPVTGKPVRVTEFFNTDTGAAQFQQMRYWVGRTAMANQGDQYKSLDALSKNREAITAHGDSIGIHADVTKKDIATYDSLVNQLLGQPLEDLGAQGIKISRNIRKLVTGNTMNKVGVPQLGESGRGLAAVGNLIEGIPMLGKMLTDIRANRLPPEVVRNLEDSLFGKIGDDYILNSSMFRGEDLGHKAGMVETALNKMGYAQGLLSGWHFINTAQRKFMVNGLSQKYFNDITQGTMTKVQMNNLGITPQMASRIKDNMLLHSTEVTKNWGRYRPKNLHVENWEPDVAKVFGGAIYRKTNNAIQGILIGEIPEFMTKEVGKVLTQFRTFNIASIGKQTRRDIQLVKAGESEPYQAMMFQYATATMAVGLKIGWDAATSGDREEYMKEHFNVGEIARQAGQYNGQIGWGFDVVDSAGAVLLPETWNPLMSRQGYRPQVGVTGMIPGVSFVDKMADGIHSTINIITGQSKDSAADARAATGWLPYQNSIVGDVLLQPIQKD